MAYSIIQNEFFDTTSDKDKLEGLINRKKVHYLETAPAHIKIIERFKIGLYYKIKKPEIDLPWQKKKTNENGLHI